MLFNDSNQGVLHIGLLLEMTMMYSSIELCIKAYWNIK